MTPPHKIRQAELGKIHLGKKQLGLDEETYRAVVARVSAKFRPDPVDSAGAMTSQERHALLDELGRLGFRPAPPREREDDWINIDPNSPDAQHKKKLLACAYELERVGAVRANSTRRWIRGFVKKITGRDALQWLDAADCNKVIEGLKGWRKKFEAKHRIAENEQRAAALPATAIAKAAAYDAMRLADEAGSPIDGIRNILMLLASQNFNDLRIEAQVAELIREFGERARRALIRWDFRKVRTELIALMERVQVIDPSIADRMLAALKPEDGEIAASHRSQNRNSKDGGNLR